MDDAILEYLVGDGHDACRIGPGTFCVSILEGMELDTCGAEIGRDLVDQAHAWRALDPELAALAELQLICGFGMLEEERAVVLTVEMAA